MTALRTDSPRRCVSLVVPLFNEQDVVAELVQRLTSLSMPGIEWDLVLVDDGSSDATRAEAERLLAAHGAGRVAALSRNFGQQAAFRAGIELAVGDAVVMMDGDLQDPPEFIPEMVAAWKRGASVVVACRRTRQERGLRRLLFAAFHWLFFKLTDGAMPRDSGTFGLMDRRVTEHLRQLHEVSLFLPALRCWPGYRRELVWYDRQERAAGKPKQSLSRLFAYAWDGIVSFSERPLRWITRMGLAVSLAGFAYAAVLVVQRILQLFGYLKELEVLGFTTIVVAVLCVGGLQLIAIGVVGEYIARIFREVKHRPVFIVASVMDAGVASAGPSERQTAAWAEEPRARATNDVAS
ncbi:MAG TPA: glycosyltransferase family 2 protein [Lacipirellulaceae bacterium]|nr:glycosyltransferase family 2 protein [Lacipirellulaceae bacterium]